MMKSHGQGRHSFASWGWERMNNNIVYLPLLALFACSAQAALVWQPEPPGKTPQVTEGSQAGHGGHGGGKTFVLIDGVSDNAHVEAELWLPTRVRRPLSLDASGKVSVKKTGLDSYHMLFAKKRHGASEEVAMRYLALRGRPAKVSPSELVDAPKAMLDITPAPLTREHQRYQSMKPVNFLIRYNGEPLARQPVSLTTTNGSEIKTVSDMHGHVSIELPDDFHDVQAGRSNNRPADFTVSTELQVDSRRYHTTVSAPYYVSPSHWQSFTGGLLAMFAGMIGGLVVLQRSRKTGSEKKAGES